MLGEEPLVAHIPSSGVPEALFEAHSLLWSSKGKEAKKVLQTQLDASATHDVWLLFGLAEICFYKFAFHESQSNKDKLTQALSDLEKGLSAIYSAGSSATSSYSVSSWIGWLSGAEAQDPAKGKDLFLKANVMYSFYYLVYALFSFRKMERMTGAYYIRKSWKYFRAAEDLSIQYTSEGYPTDATLKGLIQFGFGIFHLLLSLLPPHLQTLVSAIGFEAADRDVALHELEESLTSKSPLSVEAALCLIILKKFAFLGREEEALELFGRVKRLYPSSVVIAYFSGFLERLLGNLSDSISHYKTLNVKALEQNSIQLSTTAMYHIGYCAFLDNSWDAVQKHYEQFLSVDVETTTKRFRPHAAYQLGFVYWIRNHENKLKKILALYDKANEWLRMHETYDIYAKRKMDEFRKHQGFTPADEILVPADVLLEGRQFERCLEMLDYNITLLNKEAENDHDIPIVVLYLRGACHVGLKNNEEARKCLNEVLESKPVRETYCLPYACLLLGLVAMDERKWNTGHRYLNRIKTYTNHDWKRIISARCYSARQQLLMAEKKAKAEAAKAESDDESEEVEVKSVKVEADVDQEEKPAEGT